MAVTRSTIESRKTVQRPAVRRGRGAETFWLVIAIALVCGVWWLVFTAKVRRSTNPAPRIDLSEVDRSQNLPRTVLLSAAQTTRLDVTIDTGIR